MTKRECPACGYDISRVGEFDPTPTVLSVSAMASEIRDLKAKLEEAESKYIEEKKRADSLHAVLWRPRTSREMELDDAVFNLKEAANEWDAFPDSPMHRTHLCACVRRWRVANQKMTSQKKEDR